MANRKIGTLYIGVTSDLPARVHRHRTGRGSAFTGKYGCNRLVWYERFEVMALAKQRERRRKDWKRSWKITLIEKTNPHWDDLGRALW
ncbi:MAG: GIY-YIG nuclease family protein [Pseudomonadota bacterium]